MKTNPLCAFHPSLPALRLLRHSPFADFISASKSGSGRQTTPKNASLVTQLALLVKQTGVIKQRRSDHISALITTEEGQREIRPAFLDAALWNFV